MFDVQLAKSHFASASVGQPLTAIPLLWAGQVRSEQSAAGGALRFLDLDHGSILVDPCHALWVGARADGGVCLNQFLGLWLEVGSWGSWNKGGLLLELFLLLLLNCFDLACVWIPVGFKHNLNNKKY